jgi:hypothetical protein
LGFPEIEVPEDLKPFAERWWAELAGELAPLAGKRIDPRFSETFATPFASMPRYFK